MTDTATQVRKVAEDYFGVHLTNELLDEFRVCEVAGGDWLFRQGDNGDSLYLIASRFRVTIAQLTRWNKIDKNKILRPGQKLTMYVDVTAQSS